VDSRCDGCAAPISIDEERFPQVECNDNLLVRRYCINS
jgi:hypothetical protein